MPSTSSSPVRRKPQQDRAARRVLACLDAAEAMFAEVGFEATTMTEVAERSGSSIGTLYSYFPDKPALAMALLTKYAGQIGTYWKPLFDGVDELSAKEFAEGFFERFLAFAHDHPAYLQLLNAPIRFKRDPAARIAFRKSLVRALQQWTGSLPEPQAMLAANIMLQIMKGMMSLYAEVDTSQQPIVVAEFRDILAGYLKRLRAAC